MNLFRITIAFVFLSATLFVSSVSIRKVEAQTQPAKPAATPTPPIDEEEGVIKVDTEAVNVLFTALDKDRRLLLSLKPSDFQILENGQLQTVSSFTRQVDLPLSLSILIDVSMS